MLKKKRCCSRALHSLDALQSPLLRGKKYYYCVLPCIFTYFPINYNFLRKLHDRRQTVQFRGLNH